MEDIIQKYKPQTVLIPEPSYNQDHRAFYDAGLVAARPHDTLWLVPEVLIYEQPHSIIWPHSQQTEPNVFIPISIEKKLHAYECYASQIIGKADTRARLARTETSPSALALVYYWETLLWSIRLSKNQLANVPCAIDLNRYLQAALLTWNQEASSRLATLCCSSFKPCFQ